MRSVSRSSSVLLRNSSSGGVGRYAGAGRQANALRVSQVNPLVTFSTIGEDDAEPEQVDNSKNGDAASSKKFKKFQDALSLLKKMNQDPKNARSSGSSAKPEKNEIKEKTRAQVGDEGPKWFTKDDITDLDTEDDESKIVNDNHWSIDPQLDLDEYRESGKNPSYHPAIFDKKETTMFDKDFVMYADQNDRERYLENDDVDSDEFFDDDDAEYLDEDVDGEDGTPKELFKEYNPDQLLDTQDAESVEEMLKFPGLVKGRDADMIIRFDLNAERNADIEDYDPLKEESDDEEELSDGGNIDPEAHPTEHDLEADDGTESFDQDSLTVREDEASILKGDLETSPHIIQDYIRRERERIGDPNADVVFDNDIPEYAEARPYAWDIMDRYDFRDPEQFFRAVKGILRKNPNTAALADYEFEDLPAETINELNMLAEELMNWDASEEHPYEVMQRMAMPSTQGALDYQIPEVRDRQRLQRSLDRENVLDTASAAAALNPHDRLTTEVLEHHEKRLENVQSISQSRIFRKLPDAVNSVIDKSISDFEAHIYKNFSKDASSENEEASEADIDRLVDAIIDSVMVDSGLYGKSVDLLSENAFSPGRASHVVPTPNTRTEKDNEYMNNVEKLLTRDTYTQSIEEFGDVGEDDVRVRDEIEMQTDFAHLDLPEESRLLRTDSHISLMETAPFLVENNPRDTVIDEPWEELKKRLLRRKGCPLCVGNRCKPLVPIDYTNIRLLNEFVDDVGAMIPKRSTGLCAKRQRQISSAVKTARRMGLMPYSAKWEFQHFNPIRETLKLDERKEFDAEGAFDTSSELSYLAPDVDFDGDDSETRATLDKLHDLQK